MRFIKHGCSVLSTRSYTGLIFRGIEPARDTEAACQGGFTVLAFGDCPPAFAHEKCAARSIEVFAPFRAGVEPES